MSAMDALFRSVQTGELSNSTNGRYGICTIGRPEVGATLANTANARMALFADVLGWIAHPVHEITNDVLLGGDIAQNLCRQGPLLGVGRVTQDATQLLQVPGRVAYKTLLNRPSRRVVEESMSLGIIFRRMVEPRSAAPAKSGAADGCEGPGAKASGIVDAAGQAS